MALSDKHILLIISGGIAAYKSLDLIRRLKERGAKVTPVMTKGAQEFITPLAVGALSATHVFTELFHGRTSRMSVISGWRAIAISCWWRPPPPISWRRWHMVWPMI